jgi:predicted lactoylglutathione lyase
MSRGIQGQSPPSQPVAFEGAQPILSVADLQRSVDYYTKVLGFTLNFHESIASVSRGRCAVFLVQGDQGNPGTWVWVGVSDVDALHDEYIKTGAKIRHPPTNFSWAYEIQVEDLDRNVLRLGCEPKAGQPFGPWRDMRGTLWGWTPAGWARKAAD